MITLITVYTLCQRFYFFFFFKSEMA